MSLVAAPAWGMAAEHNRPALLGNASATPNQALGASILRWARAGDRPALCAELGGGACTVCRRADIKAFRPLCAEVTSLPRLDGCVCTQAAYRGASHESQQHLPQQRARLLAHGESGGGRARQALLARVSAILAAPRRACGARRRRSGNARASRQLGQALIAAG